MNVLNIDLLHVGTPDQLGPEVEALPAGLLEVEHDRLVGLLEVALVRVEHDGLVLVVQPHHLDGQPVDGRLHVRLLGVDHDANVLLFGVLKIERKKIMKL